MEALKTKDEIKYRNKNITDMTRDELIEALTFAVNEIQRLYSDNHRAISRKL